MNPTLFIMRGPPGSGKSTIAKKIAFSFNFNSDVTASQVICSADDYFMVNGKYCFDGNKLKEAHADCQDKCEYLMRATVDNIIIDNCNTRRTHMNPYYDLAGRYGYEVVIVECRGEFQNIHGVPPATIGRMRADMNNNVY